MLTGKKMKTIS